MIKNREAFLGALAAKLGRPVRTEPIPSAKPVTITRSRALPTARPMNF